MAEKDSSNYVRFDVRSTGPEVRLFGASVTNGTPTARYDAAISAPSGAPLWLRVKRTGSTWTASWSTNGTTFTTGPDFSFTLAVAKLGPFAANHDETASLSPAFTATVDYFFNTASPIVPEDRVARITPPFGRSRRAPGR